MNYLATYNKPIKKIRNRIQGYISTGFIMNLAYSRYDHMRGKFELKIPATSINVKETKKGVISFTFSTRGIQFEGKNTTDEMWENIFVGLRNEFYNQRHLDIKEKFLEVTDNVSLGAFLNSVRLLKPFNNGIGKKLIEIFKKTTMYKNILKDYKDFTENYEKIMGNDRREVELCRAEILKNGRIRMIVTRNNKEEKRTYDDFESLISGIIYNDCKDTVKENIESEYELFSKYL